MRQQFLKGLGIVLKKVFEKRDFVVNKYKFCADKESRDIVPAKDSR